MANPYHGPDGRFTSKEGAIAAYDQAIFNAVRTDNLTDAFALQTEKRKMLDKVAESKAVSSEKMLLLPKVARTQVLDDYKNSKNYEAGRDFDIIEYGLNQIQEDKLTEDEQVALNMLGEIGRIVNKPNPSKASINQAYEYQEYLNNLFPEPAPFKTSDLHGSGSVIAETGAYMLARHEALQHSIPRSPATQDYDGYNNDIKSLQYDLLSQTTLVHYGLLKKPALLQNAVNRVISGEEPFQVKVTRKGLTDLDNIYSPEDRIFNEIHKNNRLYLSFVFPNKELKSALRKQNVKDIDVKPFDNYREMGLTYTVKTPGGDTRTFSIYEHKNSDHIIINGKTNWNPELPEQSYGPYASDTGNSSFAQFGPDQRDLAAKTLSYFLANAQQGNLESDADLIEQKNRDWHSIVGS